MKDKRHLVKNRKRRERRRHRLRKVVSGTSERPRMVVHRSLRHIEVQLVDDVAVTEQASAQPARGRRRSG